MRLPRVDADGVRVTTSVRAMERRKPKKPPGLFGTVGTRSKVNTTSSAVSVRPSCQRTLSRSSNVWVMPSADWRKLSANQGRTAPVESFQRRVS